MPDGVQASSHLVWCLLTFALHANSARCWELTVVDNDVKLQRHDLYLG